jgi:hypothetical protein
MRITRHPTFTSLALIGLGNCLARGNLGDLVYWAGNQFKQTNKQTVTTTATTTTTLLLLHDWILMFILF